MASGNSTDRKSFPLQLSLGVLQDLLAKELDALRFPADATKKAALEAAKGSLPRRLALIVLQISVLQSADVVQGVRDLVVRLWYSIREPIGADTPFMEALTAVIEAACAASKEAKEAVCNSSLLVTHAVLGYFVSSMAGLAPHLTPPRLLELFKWWSDDVCSKRWSVTNAWGLCMVETVKLNPLFFIAKAGLTPLVPFAVSRGCDVNGNIEGVSRECPATVAFMFGHVGVLWALLEHGVDLIRPYAGDGWPAAMAMLAEDSPDSAIFAELIRRRPEILNAFGHGSENAFPTDLLGVAIRTMDPRLVDLVLSAGAPVEYRGVCKDQKTERMPSAAEALDRGNPDVLRLLATKGKVFENWPEKYDETSHKHFAVALAHLAMSAYPSNPHFTGDPAFLTDYNPRAMECLEYFLSLGVVIPFWTPHGENFFLRKLYPFYAEGTIKQCPLEEHHALNLLQQLWSAGHEVCELYRSPSRGPRIGGLPTASIAARQPKVLDWCLSKAGMPLEYGKGTKTLLALAFKFASVRCAELLLQKYKVRVAFSDRGLTEQPVLDLLASTHEYTDAEAEHLLRLLIERDRTMFALDCFAGASVAEVEEEQVSEGVIVCWNPVYLLVQPQKPRTLELLLTSGLPGVAAMVNRPVTMYVRHQGTLKRQLLTAAQTAARRKNWECLDVLLRHSEARVTDESTHFPSVVSSVSMALSSEGCPPRALVAAVLARAQKEVGDKVETAAASQAAGAATNAFEELAGKSATEKQEKKKTKKKAAKKKKKAKKRATAAHAGAGAAVADSSSDDEEEDAASVEPDDNLVDSRNAPSLDLMLKQMGLKDDAPAGGPE